MLATWNDPTGHLAGADFGAAASASASRAAYKRLQPARGIMLGVAGSLMLWGVLGAAFLPF